MIAKQYLWSVISTEVKDIREIEHKKATDSLHSARKNALLFVLPPLTEKEKLRLKQYNAAEALDES